jgi:hypothetical protein
VQRSLIVLVLASAVLSAHPADAQEDGPIHASIAKAFSASAALSDDPQSPAPRPVAFEYSDGYKTRAKIHKYASFATLPLFATELALGQSIYNNPSEGKKSAHIAVGTGIIGLFGVNAVTGVWNLVEARNDPHGHTRRLVHGILMLASNAGFVITPMVAPSHERFDRGGTSGSAATHRAVALTSIGIGTAGYLTMLIGGR